LNEEIEVSSAKYAFKLFRIGFLKDRTGYQMGVPSIQLSELYSKPTIAFMDKYQGEVILRKSITQIKIEYNEVTGIELTDGTLLSADYFISAVPFDILLNILPKSLIENNPTFSNFKQLDVSPITGIHFWFDKPITDLDHASIPYRTIQWMFNKTKNYGISNPSDNGTQYLGFVVSASKHIMDKTRDEIIQLALEEVHEVFPKSREAKLIKSIVIKEPKATFSVSPGCDQYRPQQRTSISNLWLAGDWTKTEWPATMESAVISGYLCAQDILLLDNGSRI